MISIIIPTQFGHTKLIDALRSVFSQTYEDIQVYLIQDGPPLDEEVKVKVFEFLKTESRSLHFEEIKVRSGASAARNIGIQISHGKYIAFLDDDDHWMPSKLEKQINELENNSRISVISCDYELVRPGKKGKIIRLSENNPVTSIVPLLMKNILGSCSFCVVRRDQALACKGFDENLSSAQDWDFWLRLSERFGNPFIIPEVLVRYSDDLSAHRISRSAKKRVQGYLSFLKKHNKKIPSSLWPFHFFRLIQFAANDVVGVQRIVSVLGPTIRKVIAWSTGHRYSR